MRLNLLILTVVVALILGAGVVVAAGELQVTKHAINAGTISSGNGYVLTGVIGQSAGQTSGSDEYTVNSGFVEVQQPDTPELYVPYVSR